MNHDRSSEDDRPPDPRLDPENSPGFGAGPTDRSDIEVSRDVTIGTADPEELTATDTSPVADADVDDLRSMLKTGNPVERRRAAVALSQRHSTDRAIDPLANAVLDDPDPDVRQFAVEALATHGDESVVPVIRRAANDENPWVRSEAVVTLDGLDREGNSQFLESKLTDDHHAVRRNSMIALYNLRGADALSVLLEGMVNLNDRVREWAVELLGEIDDDRARRALVCAAEDDESDFVRDTARNVLGSADDSVPSDGPDEASGSNPRYTPGKPSGRDDADGLNEPPDL